MEDAITEFVEAKRVLGSVPLSEAASGYLSTVAQVRRVKISEAVESFNVVPGYADQVAASPHISYAEVNF